MPRPGVVELWSTRRSTRRNTVFWGGRFGGTGKIGKATSELEEMLKGYRRHCWENQENRREIAFLFAQNFRSLKTIHIWSEYIELARRAEQDQRLNQASYFSCGTHAFETPWRCTSTLARVSGEEFARGRGQTLSGASLDLRIHDGVSHVKARAWLIHSMSSRIGQFALKRHS